MKVEQFFKEWISTRPNLKSEFHDSGIEAMAFAEAYHKKQLSIQRVTTRTFRFSGIRHARKFVREVQAVDRESAIADFELTYPDLTWRTTTELD